MVTVPCLVTVAAGVFAPGHLGELTRYLPFELVDDVLAMTGTVQKRMRVLPSRVGMYFVLALTLFPGIGYLRVWDKLTSALEDLDLPRPWEKSLRDLRRRIGPAAVKALFETVAVPLAPPGTPGVFYRGLRTVAFDGLNSVKVPDSDRNRSWLGKTMTRLGLAGYPAMRIVALAETGTRGLLGAVIGGRGERSEVPLARKLVPLLREGMLLLADRAYDAANLLNEVAATGAHFLVRGSASRKPAVGEVLPDGSYLSQIDGLAGADHRGGPGRARRRRDPDRGQLPADHHTAGLAALPGRRADPAVSRALGDRGRLPRAAPHPARRVRAPLPRPGRRRAGTMGAAGRVPGAAHGDDRRRRRPPGPTRTGPASPPRSNPRGSRSSPRAASKTPATQTTPAGSAAPSSQACCPPGGHATAPGK